MTRDGAVISLPVWRWIGWGSLAVIIICGLVLRFINLDTKLYWQDESAATMRSAGYLSSELETLFVEGSELHPQELVTFLRLAPGRGVGSTLLSVMRDNPHSPPLYPILARLWRQAVGDSTTTIRAMSAVASVLMLVSLFWLCLELLGDPHVGWLTVGLAAVSPFHLLYAQEAREYSLWAMLTCLSSATLLWAQRQRRRWAWLAYTVCIVIGLYTHLFFAFVILAHGVYILSVSLTRQHWRNWVWRDLLAFAVVGVVSLVAFTPWLYVIATNWATLDQRMEWVSQPITKLALAQRWAIGLFHLFFEQLGQVGSGNFTMFRWVGGIAVSSVVILILVWLVRTLPRRVWLFILTLILVPAAVLVVPDLVRGGQTSAVDRYLTPAYLGIEIAVGAWLAHTISSASWRRYVGLALAGFILIGGLLSVNALSPVKFTRNKGDNFYLVYSAGVINPVPQPVVMLNMLRTPPYTFLVLGQLLENDTQLRLVYERGALLIPPKGSVSRIFVLYPSDGIRQRLRDAGEQFMELSNGQLLLLQ